MWKMSIQYLELVTIPRSLEHESSTRTTRPGLAEKSLVAELEVPT